MKLVARGAEAILYRKDGLLIKDRIKKSYRIKEIDLKLRKERTRLEARLLSTARRVGVLTPKIVGVDEKNFRIVMEFIEGERVKEMLNRLDKPEVKKLCYEIGRCIGKLHSAGIIHGDLTTSNMIVKEGKLFFIDFGLGFLSKKIEDQGTDLHLLYQALKSTHFNLLETCWDFIKRGYKEEYKKAKDVFEKIKEIEGRGRYAKRSYQAYKRKR
ncbi:MAG TPA: Kae1-associated serine/threonine protein kinase [Candidatus Aenigmarchaeota archaeon]|nr:Kae1-associated serine/threonine protein kinase [Candidatus Aenigmarchaeota archaeon]